VGSAHGFLGAPMGYEVVRTRLMALPAYDAGMLNTLFAAMRAEAEAVVCQGTAAPLVEVRTAFMRYRGQGHEVPVPIPDGDFTAEGEAPLRAAFEATYDALYGRTIPKLDIEALTWTLSLAEARGLPARLPDAPPAEAPEPAGHRRMTDPGTGGEVLAALYERAALPPGASVAGPAVIVEAETSTLIPTGFRAGPNAAGHILIERIRA